MGIVKLLGLLTWLENFKTPHTLKITSLRFLKRVIHTLIDLDLFLKHLNKYDQIVGDLQSFGQNGLWNADLAAAKILWLN